MRDFLEKVTVEKEILSVARVAKERKEKEKESKRRKVEEVEEKKVSVVPENVTKVPKKEEEEEKFPVKVENKEESGPRAPNLGNGLDLDKYSWTQSLQEVTAVILVPVGNKFSLIGFKNTLDFLRMRVFEVALDNMQAKHRQSRIPTNLGGAEDDLDMYGGGIKTSATTIDWGQVI
ncbi:hypothetical protein G4B88_007822 [Cannabis sativa]|uniref:Uncharacterized protein n=1 Tax=Cannabis sativa TaxID=3483 RepID=A0A7J6ER22_CANSA|nr:hypothetical protein G4B88_007822 [Cannabis sativa]